jgi:sigma non-opioid intracellular receptor
MGYIFDPDVLHTIAKKGVGRSHKEMVQTVSNELAAAYPGHVETREEWIFNMAAGAIGVMTVLHASLSEYVIIFGSPVGTGGFSGRYKIEIFDFMMAGDMWTYTDDNIGERVVTRPGEMAHLAAERVKGFKLPEGAWMLEYGRGPVPTALPLALADALLSAMDLYTVYRTLWIYTKMVTRELLKGKI